MDNGLNEPKNRWESLKANWGTIKKALKWIAVTLCVVAIAVITVSLVRCAKEVKSEINEYFETNKGIDVTQNVVTEIRSIGQWEFLAINDEEMIDTINKGFFSDSELARIYYGTLRIGIDFSECEGSWIKVDGDSLILDLPPVKLLDENFLDETRTRAFIEKGRWSNADRQAMAQRAKEAMKRRCLTPENMAHAQKTADRQVRQLLKKIISSPSKSYQTTD